jgi:MYXO-CTERM domain-containing protein
MAANYAVWNVEMGASGTFRIEAYTDAAWAESARAAYDVDVNGDVERYVIDQTATDGWRAIATRYLEAGDSVEVRLDDNTGEPNSDDIQLVADALRFVPTENLEDLPPDAALGGPRPVEDARVEPSPLPLPTGDDATLAGPADDVERDESLDGCASGGDHGSIPWLLVVALALAPLRRRWRPRRDTREERKDGRM